MKRPTIKQALENANDLCRSMHAIARRKGESTNWDAFLKQLEAGLIFQHQVMYPPKDQPCSTSKGMRNAAFRTAKLLAKGEQ